MSVRDMLLGKSGGQTLFSKMKKGWQDSKNREERAKHLSRAYNPLKCQPGDTIELGAIDKTSYQVKSILYYETAPQDPDFVRYSLEPLEGEEERDLSILEVMPDPDSSDLLFSRFKLIDEFELDEQLINIMENEDVLTQTVPLESGEQKEFDFEKDFVTTATVQLISADSMEQFKATGVNYFIEHPTEGELYLCVEILEESEWMHFWEGKRLRSIEVSALGTLS